MLRKLLSNAAKFSPAGAAIEVSIGSLRDGSLQLSVADIGIGMTPRRSCTGGSSPLAGSRAGGSLKLSVADIGIGMTPRRSCTGGSAIRPDRRRAARPYEGLGPRLDYRKQ